MTKPSKEFIDQITKRLVDEGKLIEAGWVGLKLVSIPEGAPQIQLDEMRNAFFAGAQHLWASIMGILEPNAEPTANDLRRMDLIDKELGAFIIDYKRNHFQ